MKAANLIGWALFLLGLGLIFYSLFTSWQIFTGRSELPPAFKVVSFSVEDQGQISLGIPLLDEQLNKFLGQSQDRLSQLLSLAGVNRVLDLLTWTFFAGFLLFAGNLLASLGIKLIK